MTMNMVLTFLHWAAIAYGLTLLITIACLLWAIAKDIMTAWKKTTKNRALPRNFFDLQWKRGQK